EIASALNVDFSHIEQTALQIAKSDRETHLVLGQLVSYHYLDNLARQINENLQQKGTISIPSLTKEYDLPTEFLVDEVSKRIGSIIQGFKDESDPKVKDELYVSGGRISLVEIASALNVDFSHIEQTALQIAKSDRETHLVLVEIASALNVDFSHIEQTALQIAKSDRETHLVLVDEVSKRIGSIIQGFKDESDPKYDSVSRLGISDPIVFLKKKFKDEKMVYLDTCVLGPALLDQIETAVSEALGAGSWIDLVPLLPSILSQEDEAQLVSSLVGGRAGTLILGGTTLLSNKLVEDVKTGLEADMESRDVESGLVQQCLVDNRGAKDLDEEKIDRKDERRKKAAGGKAGGGAQGRETKTKSTKKKGGKKKDDDWEDSDEEVEKKGGKGEKGGKKKELEYKSFAVLKQEISALPHLQDELDRRYKEVSKEVYQSTLAASLQSKKRTHSDLQEKVNNMFTTLRLNERAIQEFKVDEHKTALSKHLLKTLGSELVTEIFLYLAEDNMIK
ncbi:E3 UFM1-protein ligase 1, partial [Eurytemora carolleeae]|uniref:E3 UFM1-protein ligase 1 n=1 Tax=Eurytemora carolleeae TaxID=1294199 RepID=UPI000C77B89A